MAILIQCDAETTYSEARDGQYIYVETSIDSSEADAVFDCIKEYVDHDDMMKCLSREEVIEFFDIEEAPDA